ncbi:MAG TPA: membrane protein insertion efficiency factor YidD [Lentisphaeria bacterium]|nr:membrane protein insertion efficiency factor YidD [Lentisphaeria bacterium]
MIRRAWELLWQLPRGVAVASVRAYRVCISPLLPPACRFVPTCSEYAITAFRAHGFFAGLGLTVYRILRCNPFCKGGYDPVPCSEHEEPPDG